MNDNLSNDDLMFDRLVDGELSAAERHRLLASLDDRPDGWRHCALVFLEAQCWSEELAQFVRKPADTPATTDDRGTRLATARSTSYDLETRRHSVGWLAIAAGLMAAFTFGLMLRDQGTPNANRFATTPDRSAPDASQPTALPDAEKLDDALTLWVRDQNGRARSVNVPLVDAGTLDEQFGLQFQTGVPAEVRSQLLGRGFDVQSKRRYAPLWLENGRPMIVPVEDTKIVPVSQTVY